MLKEKNYKYFIYTLKVKREKYPNSLIVKFWS